MSDVEAGAATAASEPAAIAPAQTAEQPTNTMDRLIATMSETYDKVNPAREATGQFKAKDETPAEGATEASDAATETTDPPQTEATSEPAVPAIVAPVSWSADMKAKWATLPSDAQAYIAQREGEAHKRISELGQTAKALEPVRNVLERHNGTFQRYGVDAATGISQLMAYFAQSESDPRGFIEQFARSKGIDLSGQTPTDQSEYIRSLESRVARAEQTANEVHSRIAARERTELERTQASLASVIETFTQDKPDFAEIENDILAHVQAIRTAEPGLEPEKVLSKAYEAARWANPTIREKILAEQRKAEEDKRIAEAKKKADEAKKSASLNVKSAVAAPARKGSWEQTLREVGERVAS